MSLRDRVKRLEQSTDTSCPGCQPGIVFADERTLPDGTKVCVPPLPTKWPPCRCKVARPGQIVAIVFASQPAADAAYPKYPPQPVVRCGSFQSTDEVNLDNPDTPPDLHL
jgi:hypothetical protein